MKILSLCLLLLSLCVTGCAGYREAVRNLGHASGAITPQDIQQADQYRKFLPSYLGLPSKDITVSPGSGITHARIRKIADGPDRARITGQINELNTSNPKLNPVDILFE